jgi:hypothetical protein
MYILDRIISRSSRSLAAMIGFSWVANGNAHGGRSGIPDDDAAVARGSHVPFSPLRFFSSPIQNSQLAPRIARRANGFMTKGDSPWIVEHS